ncbi:hypothetical protein SNE40_022516 [Patella caerulea]
MGMLSGQRLLNVTFSTNVSNGLMDCCRRCQMFKICSSVNFNLSSSVCELNLASTGLFKSQHDYEFIDTQSWPSLVFGSCAHHDCLLHQRCEEGGNSEHTCVPIGCGSPPDIPFINRTSFGGKVLWQFNEIVAHVCSVGYYPSTNVTCMENGNWVNFTCEPFRTCANIKKCHANPNNTEFWLRPFTDHSQTIKIYCQFSEKATAHITVKQPNRSVMSGMVRSSNDSCDATVPPVPPHQNVGETQFSKVSFRVVNMFIKPRNHIYANITLHKQSYGSAGDCYASNDTCGVKGEFVINLTGTGIRLNSSVEWETWGVEGRIEYLNRSDDGLVVQGACGGSCGGCKPKTKLFIEPDPNYTPPDDSAAISPNCVSLV